MFSHVTYYTAENNAQFLEHMFTSVASVDRNCQNMIVANVDASIKSDT